MYEPIREAMSKTNVNHDREQEFSFKSNYQREMLCAGQTFRVRPRLSFRVTLGELGQNFSGFGQVLQTIGQNSTFITFPSLKLSNIEGLGITRMSYHL